ncbi:MAG: hypothetical protein AAFV26_09180, partial [Pseudomonadota bacterium]
MDEQAGGETTGLAASLSARLERQSPLAEAAARDPRHPLARTLIDDDSLETPEAPDAPHASGPGDADLDNASYEAEAPVADEVDPADADDGFEAHPIPEPPRPTPMAATAEPTPLPRPVPAPKRKASPHVPIRLERNADGDDFNHLSDESRSRIEDLIARQEQLEAAPASAPDAATAVQPGAGAGPSVDTAEPPRTPTSVRPAAAAKAPKADIKASIKALKLNRDGELWTALMESRGALYGVGGFSFAINLLML